MRASRYFSVFSKKFFRILQICLYRRRLIGFMKHHLPKTPIDGQELWGLGTARLEVMAAGNIQSKDYGTKLHQI